MQLSPRAYKLVTSAICFAALLVVAELISIQAEETRLPIWFYVIFFVAVMSAVWLMMTHLFTQETALRNSRADMLAVLGAVDDGFITLDVDGRIKHFSEAARRIFDCTLDDIRDMPFEELFATESRPASRDALAQMMADESDEMMDFDLDLAGVRAYGNAFPLRIAKAKRSRSAVRDMVIMVRDMSEQFRLDRLKQEFVSTISHQLRTPLTSIQGSLGLIRAGVVGEVPEKMAGMI